MPESPRDWTIEYAHGLFRTGIEQLVDNAAPGLTDRLANDAAAWDELIGVTNLAVIESESLLRETVIAARNAGRTWTQIAAALGISRGEALTRFSAQTETANTGTAPTESATEVSDDAEIADPLLSRQMVRDMPFYSVDPLNDAGKYGWHSVRVTTNDSITGVNHLMEPDTQQWEHACRVPRKRREVEGWQKLKVDGPVVGINYWTRPLGIPALPGKPEPQRFAIGNEVASQRRLAAAKEWLS